MDREGEGLQERHTCSCRPYPTVNPYNVGAAGNYLAAPILFLGAARIPDPKHTLDYGVGASWDVGLTGEFLARAALGCRNLVGIKARARSRETANSFQSRLATGSDGGNGRRSKFRNCPWR